MAGDNAKHSHKDHSIAAVVIDSSAPNGGLSAAQGNGAAAGAGNGIDAADTHGLDQNAASSNNAAAQGVAASNTHRKDGQKRQHTLMNVTPGMVYLQYKILGKKGEGTFSQVLKAQNLRTGKYVAIKCMKNCFDGMDKVNRLREIQALQRLSPHPNIIKLMEVLFDKATGSLSLVFELMDKNIYELISSQKNFLTEDKIKSYMYQLIKSMDHMHKNGIFHRDIKPENILVQNDVLKLADFGSCRGIYSKQPFTEYISTRWYRAPECLLTDGYYNYKMDMWGIGCVFYEIITLVPLFPGNNEVDQVHKIHGVMGTPPAEVLNKFKKHASAHISFDFPHVKGQGLRKLLPQNISPECLDLMSQLLTYDPDARITAKQALQHPYFRELHEMDKAKSSAKTHQKNLMNSSLDGKIGGTVLPSLSSSSTNGSGLQGHNAPITGSSLISNSTHSVSPQPMIQGHGNNKPYKQRSDGDGGRINSSKNAAGTKHYASRHLGPIQSSGKTIVTQSSQFSGLTQQSQSNNPSGSSVQLPSVFKQGGGGSNGLRKGLPPNLQNSKSHHMNRPPHYHSQFGSISKQQQQDKSKMMGDGGLRPIVGPAATTSSKYGSLPQVRN